MRTFFHRALTALFLCVVITIQLSACGKAKASVLEGKWGYIHDPSTVILEVKGDRLTYGDKKYSFSMDQNYLYLKGEKEELKLRYLISGEHTYLYQTTEYTLTTAPSEDTLVGKWENKEKNGALNSQKTENS